MKVGLVLSAVLGLASACAPASATAPTTQPTASKAALPAATIDIPPVFSTGTSSESCREAQRFYEASQSLCTLRAVLESGQPPMRISLDVERSGDAQTETLSVYQSPSGREERLWLAKASAQRTGGEYFSSVFTYRPWGSPQLHLAYVAVRCAAACGPYTVFVLAVVDGVFSEVLRTNTSSSGAREEDGQLVVASADGTAAGRFEWKDSAYRPVVSQPPVARPEPVTARPTPSPAAPTVGAYPSLTSSPVRYRTYQGRAGIGEAVLTFEQDRTVLMTLGLNEILYYVDGSSAGRGATVFGRLSLRSADIDPGLGLLSQWRGQSVIVTLVNGYDMLTDGKIYPWPVFEVVQICCPRAP